MREVAIMYHATSRVMVSMLVQSDDLVMTTMGLDKLRLISRRAPSDTFLAEVNAEKVLREDQRRFVITTRNPSESHIARTSMCTISSTKHAFTGFFLQMHYNVPGTGRIHVLELNPNKLPHGCHTLAEVVTWIFEDAVNELKISRLDLHADIELPVDYFRRTLRVSPKRKTSAFVLDRGDYTNRGLTGFYIGRSP